MRRQAARIALGGAMVAGLVVAVPPGPAAAEVVVTVTTTADVVNGSDGVISLREALTSSGSDGDDTRIVLAAGATYLLDECGLADNGTLISTPDDNLTIEARGARIEQTCDGAGVLSIDAEFATFRIEDAIVTGGDRAQPSPGLGGGIGVLHGDAEIVRTTIAGNRSAQFAGGGGLYVDDGTVTIIDSTLAGNDSTSAGSAMVVKDPTTIDGSAIVDNHAGSGPAVYHFADLDITNSTLAGNANDDSTGAALSGNGAMSLVHSTLGGTDPTQIAYGAPVTFAGSVLFLTGPGTICGVSNVTSLGHNYATDPSCGLDDATDSQSVSNDPMLRSLFLNGGTPSFYPEPTSPLLDAVPAADPQLPATDQRGVDRPQGALGDIGSIEVAVCGDLFPDVEGADPFCWEIGWLSGSGITTGFPDGTFRPDGQVTRQSMAAFMYRLAGSPRGPEPTCTRAPFPDVPVSHPFCGEIDWLVDEGVTTGYADGTYRPTANVTRQSMAAFMYRLAGSPDGDEPTCASAPFPDVPVSHPFCGEIDWLVDAGVTTGYADGTYRPTANVTRQSMAAFMYRLADGLIPLPQI